MTTMLHISDSAIARGIKTAGIGKKGSKALENSLIAEIRHDIEAGKVSPIELGAFLGGLWLKGLTPEERSLEQALGKNAFADARSLAQILCADAPSDIRALCTDLLEGKTLSKEQASRLGEFLLSDEPGEASRGLAVSILRVRYETDDEYEGLLKSFQASLEKDFRTPAPAGQDIIQLAEPFDGMDHSYLVTPLIARYLQTLDYHVISLVGRNSGPKFGNNLLALCKELSISPVKSNHELKDAKPPLGWYFNQEDISKPIDRWVERRHKTIKRPCFATLEKFLNPVGAKIIITSAFHPPYSEKMTTIAERAGFAGSIVVRNGLEGALAFPLKREVKILCSARTTQGGHKRNEIVFDPAAFLGRSVELEEVLENPSLRENARLVKLFAEKDSTDNTLFDLRVKATCGGLRLALEWLKENMEVTANDQNK